MINSSFCRLISFYTAYNEKLDFIRRQILLKFQSKDGFLFILLNIEFVIRMDTRNKRDWWFDCLFWGKQRRGSWLAGFRCCRSLRERIGSLLMDAASPGEEGDTASWLLARFAKILPKKLNKIENWKSYRIHSFYSGKEQLQVQ